jgi:hypothetical protein
MKMRGWRSAVERQLNYLAERQKANTKKSARCRAEDIFKAK